MMNRRDFIRSLASGLFLAAAPEVLVPERKMWFVARNAPVLTRAVRSARAVEVAITTANHPAGRFVYEAEGNIYAGTMVTLTPEGRVRPVTFPYASVRELMSGEAQPDAPVLGVALAEPDVATDFTTEAMRYYADRWRDAGEQLERRNLERTERRENHYKFPKWPA